MEEFPSVIRGKAVFGILVSVFVMMMCVLRETRLTSLNDDDALLAIARFLQV